MLKTLSVLLKAPMGGLLGSVTVGANKQTDLKRISIKSCRSCYDELIVCSVEGKYVRFNKRKNPIEFIKNFVINSHNGSQVAYLASFSKCFFCDVMTGCSWQRFLERL